MTTNVYQQSTRPLPNIQANDIQSLTLEASTLTITGGTFTNLTATNLNLTNITGTNLSSTNITGTNITSLTKVQVNGGILGHISSTGGIWNLSATDYAILFTGSSGTLILPSATSVPGITYKIFNNTSGTITATGALINGTGSTPFSLSTAKNSVNQLTSDGISSFWLI